MTFFIIIGVCCAFMFYAMGHIAARDDALETIKALQSELEDTKRELIEHKAAPQLPAATTGSSPEDSIPAGALDTYRHTSMKPAEVPCQSIKFVDFVNFCQAYGIPESVTEDEIFWQAVQRVELDVEHIKRVLIHSLTDSLCIKKKDGTWVKDSPAMMAGRSLMVVISRRFNHDIVALNALLKGDHKLFIDLALICYTVHPQIPSLEEFSMVTTIASRGCASGIHSEKTKHQASRVLKHWKECNPERHRQLCLQLLDSK